MLLQVSKFCQPRIHSFVILIILRWLFLRHYRQQKFWKPSRRHVWGKAPFVRVSPLLHQEAGDDSVSRNSYQWRSKDINLHNKHTLVYSIFLVTSHIWFSTPNIFSVFSWRWYLRCWLWPFLRIGFPGSLPWMQEVYMLINFCLIFLLLICHINLILSPARRTLKDRGKFFFPNTSDPTG